MDHEVSGAEFGDAVPVVHHGHAVIVTGAAGGQAAGARRNRSGIEKHR